jgi:hypothetical protein
VTALDVLVTSCSLITPNSLCVHLCRGCRLMTEWKYAAAGAATSPPPTGAVLVALAADVPPLPPISNCVGLIADTEIRESSCASESEDGDRCRSWGCCRRCAVFYLTFDHHHRASCGSRQQERCASTKYGELGVKIQETTYLSRLSRAAPLSPLAPAQSPSTPPFYFPRIC